MVIALSVTKNWYHFLTVNLYSLLSTNKWIKKIYLFVETNDIKDIKYLDKLADYFKVTFVVQDFNQIYDKYLSENKINYSEFYTKFTFCRLLLPDLISEDKVLYLDGDTLVVKDIKKLSSVDMGNNYIMGCKNYGEAGEDKEYFLTNYKDSKMINAGVMLMNLKKMREDNLIDKFISTLQIRHFVFPDETAINIACNGKIDYIEDHYNYLSCFKGYYGDLELKDISIIHYFGDKSNWVKGKEYNHIWYKKEKEFYDFMNIKYDISIIVEVNKNTKNIHKLLASIGLQKDLNIEVLLIDNNSNLDYSKVLELFKDKLTINTIKLDKEYKTGYVFNRGIDYSIGKYVMFMNGNDSLYNYRSLRKLRYDNDPDIVFGNTIYNENKENDSVLGKLYKKDFLINHYIVFNEYSNNLLLFNILCSLCTTNTSYMDLDVYCILDKEKEPTNIEELIENNKKYNEDMEWLIKEANKNNCDKKSILNVIYVALVVDYYFYLDIYNKEFKNEVLKNYKELYKYYDSNKNILSEDEKGNLYRIITRNYIPVISFNTFLDLIKGEL